MEFEKILNFDEIFRIQEKNKPTIQDPSPVAAVDEAEVIENISKLLEVIQRHQLRYRRFLSGKVNPPKDEKEGLSEYFSWTKHLLKAGVKLHTLPVLE